MAASCSFKQSATNLSRECTSRTFSIPMNAHTRCMHNSRTCLTRRRVSAVKQSHEHHDLMPYPTTLAMQRKKQFQQLRYSDGFQHQQGTSPKLLRINFVILDEFSTLCWTNVRQKRLSEVRIEKFAKQWTHHQSLLWITDSVSKREFEKQLMATEGRVWQLLCSEIWRVWEFFCWFHSEEISRRQCWHLLESSSHNCTAKLERLPEGWPDRHPVLQKWRMCIWPYW